MYNLPQLGLTFAKRLNEHFQSPYWRRLQLPLRDLIEKLSHSQTLHELREQFKLQEDPWENYLYHDGKQLVELLAHAGISLKPAEQVLTTHFLLETVKAEAISQYALDGSKIIKKLLEFVRETDYDDDDLLIEDGEGPAENVLEKIGRLLAMGKDEYTGNRALVADVDQEMARLVRMFHLRMKVDGHVKEYRKDYFR